MKKPVLFGMRFSFNAPKGFRFSESTEKEIKRDISAKRVFLPRLTETTAAGRRKRSSSFKRGLEF